MRGVLWLLVLSLFSGCGKTPPSFVERPPLKGHTREVSSIAFSPDGKSLASRGGDSIRLWSLKKAIEPRIFASEGSALGNLAFAPDGKTLAANWPSKGVVLQKLETDQPASFYTYPPDNAEHWSCYSVSYGWGLAYSPDGKTLAGGDSHQGEDGFLTLWDVPSGKGFTLTPSGGPITTVAYSPDGQTIATGGLNQKLVLWNSQTRKERLTIEAGRSYLGPVIFSPDGRFVVSADESRWVRFWDAKTGKNAASFKGHIKAILSLAFHPDGKTLVSGDSGGTIFVWDVESRSMLTRLESSERGKVWSLAFSPDGKVLAAGSEDKLVHIWDVIPPPGAKK